MSIKEEYTNGKFVTVIFTKKWVGWYDVINEIGNIKQVKKYRDRYMECSGFGDPIFDITKYVEERV